jgi:curved DNA-binding protein CbpA
LFTKEALDVLALRPGATSVEIKEAYRDLVKVWHPDRFGSDPRLRQKAEEKLKQINEAYLVLQSDRGTVGAKVGEAEGAASSTRGDVGRRSNSSSAPRTGGNDRVRGKGISVGVGWLYGFVGIALGLMMGYAVLEHGGLQSAQQGARSSTAAAQEGEASSQKMTETIPATRTLPATATPGEALAGLGRKVRPQVPGISNRLGSAQFRVRSLSGVETDRLESACSKLKELKDSAAYQTCVKAQLDVITNAGGQPDLSALSGAERESMESVCSEAKRLHGMDGYRRCLMSQMATLAAEPARPDLSGLDDADRSSIEAACRNAKYREGPAAYNRCRAGLVKLLAESKKLVAP